MATNDQGPPPPEINPTAPASFSHPLMTAAQQVSTTENPSRLNPHAHPPPDDVLMMRIPALPPINAIRATPTPLDASVSTFAENTLATMAMTPPPHQVVRTETTIPPPAHSYPAITPNVDTDMLDEPIPSDTTSTALTAAPGAGADVPVEADARILTDRGKFPVSRAFPNRFPPMSHTNVNVQVEADVVMLPDRVQSSSSRTLANRFPPMSQDPSHRPFVQTAAERLLNVFGVRHSSSTEVPSHNDIDNSIQQKDTDQRLPRPATRADDILPDSSAQGPLRSDTDRPTQHTMDTDQIMQTDTLPLPHAATRVENPAFQAAQTTPTDADRPTHSAIDPNRITQPTQPNFPPLRHATAPAAQTTPIFPPPRSTPHTANIPGVTGVAQYLHDTVEHALRANLPEILELSADRALEKLMDTCPNLKRIRKGKGKERVGNNAESDADDVGDNTDELRRVKKRHKGPRGHINFLHVCSSFSDLATFPLLNAVK